MARAMRSLAIGRKIRKKADRFELRESQLSYNGLFDTEKSVSDKNMLFPDH